MNPSDTRTRELPVEYCQHANESIIRGDDDAYADTHVQCSDCGSVRIVSAYEKDTQHGHTEW